MFRSYVVALVCPERGALGRLADRLGKGGQPIEQLIEDRNLIIEVLQLRGILIKFKKISIKVGKKLCLFQTTMHVFSQRVMDFVWI